MEESGPSLVHPHPPGAVDALPKHASDRCRLGSVVGAVPVCLERGTEVGDGVGIRRHLDEGTNHWYEDSAVIAVGLKFFRKWSLLIWLVAWYLPVQFPRSLLVVTCPTSLASIDCCPLFEGRCDIGAAAAASREHFVVGEATFPKYCLSASRVSCDKVACVDDRVRDDLLEHPFLPIGQAPQRGEDVLAVSRFASIPSSMGKTAGRQGPRNLIHHNVVEGTVAVTCDSRRALDVVAKQVYLLVWPGDLDGLPYQGCAG